MPDTDHLDSAAQRSASSTQLVLAHGASTLIAIAAAHEAGLLRRAGRRVLVLSNDAETPEVTAPLQDLVGFDSLTSFFDDVVSYNEAIAPFHPAGWLPRPGDEPLWERFFREQWKLGDGRVHLLVNHLHESPARTLARSFSSAKVDAYAATLAGYGPTGMQLGDDIGARIRRVLHLDLIPELTPHLLTEWAPKHHGISRQAFTRAIGRSVALDPAPDSALLLGQDLGTLGLDRPERSAAYRRMLQSVARAGLTHVLFTPHTTTSHRAVSQLKADAEQLGLTCEVITDEIRPDQVIAGRRPRLVVGCTSPTLFTAARWWNVPAATIADDRLLARLNPWAHPERLAMTLACAVLPNADELTSVPAAPVWNSPAWLWELITALSWSLQPVLQPELRTIAVKLQRENPEVAARYLGQVAALSDEPRAAVRDILPLREASRPLREASRMLAGRLRRGA